MIVYGLILYLQTFRFLACGLKTVGVVFENYDLHGLKTVNHVCVFGAEKTAWFKDLKETSCAFTKTLREDMRKKKSSSTSP